MAMANCRDCGLEVSTAAASCPRCGRVFAGEQRQPAPTSASAGLVAASAAGVGLVAAFVVVAMGQCTTARADRQRAEAAAAVRERDSAEVVRADHRRVRLRGREAIATDSLAHAHGGQWPHPTLHAGAVSASLDSAQALINRKASPQAVVAQLARAYAPGAPDSTKARRDALSAEIKPRMEAARARQEAARSRQRDAQIVSGIGARKAYAAAYEDRLLDKGINATVTVSGKDATSLRMKWILVSKVVAHQYAKGNILFEMRTMGFRRFEITDGYDESWTWDLTTLR